MEEVESNRKQLESLFKRHNGAWKKELEELDTKKQELSERLSELNKKKECNARDHGDVEAKDDDLIEINAGGETISAKRGVLTQLKGTKLEAMFSGRWDKRLRRDCDGRIFIDANPVCFRAIVDYLNERAISSPENPPDSLHIDAEYDRILKHQVELFGLDPFINAVDMPESTIVTESEDCTVIHDWLAEQGDDGTLRLLHHSSRDGFDDAVFHSNCGNQDKTLTVIKTDDGYVFGGYSNTPWNNNRTWNIASKAFLFAITGKHITLPVKMKPRNADTCAINCHSNCGPTFGDTSSTYDLHVDGSTVYFGMKRLRGFVSPPGMENTPYIFTGVEESTISEMEVFEVTGSPPSDAKNPSHKKKQQRRNKEQMVKVDKNFSGDMNDALIAQRKTLYDAEEDICLLDKSFQDEGAFISSFASGDSKDIILLNVSGTAMATSRSTLRLCEESTLARQFDDSMWTEQGSGAQSPVTEWSNKEVISWLVGINVSENVIESFKKHTITGEQMIFLGKEGLKDLGVTGVGVVYHLLGKIKQLEQASNGVVTLIEHSPYCFGKIIDCLRLKSAYSQGLARQGLATPVICDTEKKRFEKVVKYFFPGESSKFILG